MALSAAFGVMTRSLELVAGDPSIVQMSQLISGPLGKPAAARNGSSALARTRLEKPSNRTKTNRWGVLGMIRKVNDGICKINITNPDILTAENDCKNNEAIMPLSMNKEVFITAAVTGSGGTQDKSPHVPRSPEQIANSAIDAAKAGAAVVHCHVRDPETGAPSRDLKYYRELTERVRAADVDVVLNLTAGMGGDIVFGSTEAPLPVNEAATDMIGASERMAHIADCLPEICTLDCGTMNFAEADYVMTNTPGMLRAMGQMMTDLGVKPEIEAFDTGHLWFAKQLVSEGILESPALVQLCMGIPWGAPNDLNTFMAMVNNVPSDWNWSAFSIGRDQMPYVAASVLAGGNVRVGLEDNIYLSKGVLATNAQLVERAVGIIEGMGANVIGPDAVRKKLGLTKREPR